MDNQKDKGQKLIIFTRIHFRETVLLPYPHFTVNNLQNFEIQLSSLLKYIRAFILKQKLKNYRYLQILVKTEKGEESIYHLIQTKRKVKIKQEEDNFYLDILLRDVQENHKNLLIQYLEQEEKYKKIMEKLSRVDDIFSRQADTLNDQEKRSIDIAYFFAQPLVINPKDKVLTSDFSSEADEVSYQKQYDGFIRILKQNTLQNITVDMMVATQVNIRDALQEKCNILHFSCHGEVSGLLIEKQYGVRHLLTSQQLIKLLQGKTKPKLIIFNVCHSAKIASDVHKKYNQIATIGYNGPSNDVYCQLLTEKFYDSIFKKNKSFNDVFEDIKNQIKLVKKAPQQAQKLKIFIKGNKFLQKSQLSTNQGWSVKWSYLQNLGKEDPLGVKKQLYEFIKSHFVSHQKQFFFLYGAQGRGKSIFIKKAALYALHRKLFTQKIYINCQLSQGDMISNVLRFKLIFQNQIFDNLQRYRNINRNRNGRMKVILIIDHCNEIIRSESSNFMKYVLKIFNKMDLGKIVLLTDILPKNVNNIRYSQMKEVDFKPNLNSYITRYYKWIKYNSQLFKNYDCYTLIKFIKSSTSNDEFLKKLKEFSQDQTINLCKVQKSTSQIFTQYQTKIKEARQKLRAFITKGHYKRNDKMFPLVQFISQFPKASSQSVVQLSNLIDLYENKLKGLTLKLVKCIKKNQNSEENQKINFILRSILQIANICFVFQRYESMVEELFKAYTLCATVLNMKNQNVNNEELIKLAQNLKLKIFIILYCYYKEASLNVFYSQNIFQEFKDQCWSQNSSQISQKHQIKQKIENFKLIQEELILQYGNTQFQDMIKFFCQFDGFIRKLSLNNCYQNLHLLTYKKTVQFFNQQIQKYYKLLSKFCQYKRQEQNKMFFSKWQLKTTHLIGLKIINSFLLYFKQNYHFQYGSFVIEYFDNYREIAEQALIYLKEVYKEKLKVENDNSYSQLYRNYMDLYVEVRFKLEKFYSALSGQRKALGNLKNLIKICIQNNFSHLKEIQEYVQQTYFNKCTILISEPLGYYKVQQRYEKQKNKGKKDNKKHLQFSSQTKMFQPLNYVRNSQKLLRLKQDVQKIVEKQIHIEIQTLTMQKIKKSNEGQQNLIYLMICDCQQKKNNVIYLQNKYGLSEQTQIDFFQQMNIKLPTASIIIAYGTDIHLLKKIYSDYIQKNHLQIALITLNIGLPSIKKGVFFQLYSIWEEHSTKEASFTYLMNFYQSFCKVYFNQHHQNQSEQIWKSYRFALRQSLIKTKLKYCQGVNNKLIIQFINQFVKENVQIYFPFANSANEPVQLPQKMANKRQYKDEKIDDSSRLMNMSSKSSQIRQWEDNEYLRSKQIGYNQFIVNFLEKLQEDYFQKDKKWRICFKSIPFDSGIDKAIIKTIYSKIDRLSMFEGGVQLIDLKKQNIQKILQEAQDQDMKQHIQVLPKFRIFFNLDESSTNFISRILDQVSWKQDFKLFIFQQSNSITREVANLNLPTKIERLDVLINKFDNYYSVIDCIFFFSRRINNFQFKFYLQKQLYQNNQEKSKLQKNKPWELKEKIIKFFIKHLNQLKNK